MGRKGFIPTEKQVTEVEALATFGIPHAWIADHIGIDEKTLRKHFKAILNSKRENWLSKLKIHAVRRAFKSDKVLEYMLRVHAGWLERGMNEDTSRPLPVVKYADRKE